MGGVRQKKKGANHNTIKFPLSGMWNKFKYDKILQGKIGGNANDMQVYMIGHTIGTGMGVALNMQDKPWQGKTSEVMISHAWNEDMAEVLSILEQAKKN